MKSSYRFIYQVTEYCNYNCSYCNQHNNNSSFNEDYYLYLYDFLSKLSKDIEIINIEYFGGEPTTHYKFKDMIKLYNNIYNIKCVLATNEDGTTYEVNNINLVENNNKFECLSFKYSGNRIKSCYSAYYNSIFTYDMIWYRCFQNKDYIPIDIKKVKNFYNLFNIMKTRPINCNFDLCCYKAELINRNMFD